MKIGGSVVCIGKDFFKGHKEREFVASFWKMFKNVFKYLARIFLKRKTNLLEVFEQ